jgi:uncharacterized protein YgbK (DUF1537 family)
MSGEKPKTLGQIGKAAYYDAYRHNAVDEDECWEASAQAVEDAYQMRALAPDEKQADAMVAVAEAAKAWAEWRLGLGQGNLVHKAEDALVEAIEALEKLEWSKIVVEITKMAQEDG